MRIAFFEDRAAADFSPIALTRPVFELLCGRFPLRERLIRNLPVTEWGAFIRGPLGETYREEHPECRINDFIWLSQAPTLLINGRWLPDPPALRILARIADGETCDDLLPGDRAGGERINIEEAGFLDGQLAYIRLDPLEAMLLADGNVDDALPLIARTRPQREASGRMLRRPWDLISYNPHQLTFDFQQQSQGRESELRRTDFGPHVAVLGPDDEVSISPWAEVEPFVTLDARRGPISVEAGALVRSFTRLEGPCHVGRDSQLFRAEIRGGSTIGPVCRVGGEVEATILHGYVNKYHDGFLGHSYVCPWVNLGALTTNSDLKNDYSAVRVPLSGEMLDTGMSKVGCFIGDHTKTALGCLFNTGSSVGVMCMILPGGRLLPKHVPSFARVWHGRLEDRLDLEETFDSCRVAMNRRNCEFTAAHERLYRLLLEQTAEERASALNRARRQAAEERRTAKSVSN